MTVNESARNHLSDESEDILLITDLQITRKAREYLHKKLKENRKLRVWESTNGIRIKNGEEIKYIYIYPNSSTLRTNLMGLYYKDYYIVKENYEPMIEHIIKKL